MRIAGLSFVCVCVMFSINYRTWYIRLLIHSQEPYLIAIKVVLILVCVYDISYRRFSFRFCVGGGTVEMAAGSVSVEVTSMVP